jgi:uncharacterized protein (DUF58 family)
VTRFRAALARFGKRMRRRRRRLRISREGKYFVGITIGIGLAAINTGNNLLYLLLGWMISVIVASGILSEQSLRGLIVTRLPPPRIFAGRPFLMGISLKNAKKRLPSFSIEIEDLIDGKPLDKKCYFLKIPSGRVQTTSYRHTFARRGLYRFQGFRVSTKFPFALFRKSRDEEHTGEVLVYPAVYPIPAPPPGAEQGGEDARSRRGRRGEFFGLREFRDGDDRRDVHWRSTARQGRLMVREYEEEMHRRATILVDNALPPEATDADRDALERAISLAASLCAHYVQRHYAVRLIARGTAVPPNAGPAQLARMLKALALMPTVSPETAFSGAPDPGAENLLVARRGHAPRKRPAGVARVLEAG